jgi:O-antigen ligase
LLASLFLVALALTVIAYGSVEVVPLNLAVLVFALLAGISALDPVGTAVGRLQALTVVTLACLLIFCAIQILPVGGDLANRAWKPINDLVNPVQGTISVAPEMTIDALPSLALPFLVFVAALAFFRGDEGGMRLWRALAYFGTGCAAFGIVQELLLPEQLLFVQKRFYVGSLTATFVNRNSAGTFFGIALLLNLGLLFFHLRKVNTTSFVKRLLSLDLSWRDKYSLLLFHVLSFLIVSVALFLTQSRGAVGATFVAAVVAVTIMSLRQLTAAEPAYQRKGLRRYAALIGSILVIVGLFALFAGRSVYRMEAQGTGDPRRCIFAATVEAIEDHPLLGTGFGTFQEVFPAYRDPECAGIFGVWDRAHNFFLEGYLGLGVPFAIAAAMGYIILLSVFFIGMRNRRKYRFVPVMGFSVLILVSLHSIVDFSLQIPGVGVYFAAAIASAATISLGRSQRGLERNSHASAPPTSSAQSRSAEKDRRRRNRHEFLHASPCDSDGEAERVSHRLLDVKTTLTKIARSGTRQIAY